MTKSFLTVVGACAFCSVVLAEDHAVHVFRKIQLSDQFWSEGANAGDFNKDGVADIVSGPFWWEGPDFKKRHEYDRADTRKSPGGQAPFELQLGPMTKVKVPGFHGALGKDNAYSDNFFAYAHDFNADGWQDILILGFPGEKSSWFENPQGRGGHWKEHVILDVTDNESPTFTDITGDGKPEIVCSSKGAYGYAEPDWSDATKPWKFHAISPNNKYHRFTHGLGVGDVNGDGKLDLLEKDGWWEQPASLAGDPLWRQHKFPFAAGQGSAQMFTYDVNGDGLNDVITSLAAHGYGLAWYEQLREREADGEIRFTQHNIMEPRRSPQAPPPPNKYGVRFSQLHAVDLVDMDGDGLKDIVTGKRFWAHGPKGDEEPGADAVLYWFKLVRAGDKAVDWLPFRIDHDSGIGTQVVARDVNGDQRPDVVVGNKKGTFVFLNERKSVSKEEWEKAQPKAVAGLSAATR
ncbi:MAG TPA: VCBS repeat-containing protein [Methylomirabilota bacterium]|nr:VCBS repeat-containing protein [Methylomirabilota bacterium]